MTQFKPIVYNSKDTMAHNATIIMKSIMRTPLKTSLVENVVLIKFSTHSNVVKTGPQVFLMISWVIYNKSDESGHNDDNFVIAIFPPRDLYWQTRNKMTLTNKQV